VVKSPRRSWWEVAERQGRKAEHSRAPSGRPSNARIAEWGATATLLLGAGHCTARIVALSGAQPIIVVAEARERRPLAGLGLGAEVPWVSNSGSRRSSLGLGAMWRRVGFFSGV
jgi:hypothetical protein